MDEGGVTIEVIDQGEGIAQADREKIFDEFVQLGKTQRTEGTGLGLPISRRLAEMLNGRLEIESEISVGSTFRLVVPSAATTQPARISPTFHPEAIMRSTDKRDGHRDNGSVERPAATSSANGD